MAINYINALIQMQLIDLMLSRLRALTVIAQTGRYSHEYMAGVVYTPAEITALENQYYTLKNDLNIEVCKL